MAVAALLFLSGALSVHADGYPRSAINLIVPLAAGDAGDVAARALAEELSKLLKVPVVVVNKPGAGGALATEFLVMSNKDGYSLLFSTNAALTIRRVVDPDTAKYIPERDLVALGITTRTPNILAVRSDAPFKTFAEMVDYSTNNPGKVRIGTAGVGSIGEFTVAAVNSLTSAGITIIPFTGASPAVAMLRGGHVEGVSLALGVVSSHLRSGAMKGIIMSSKFPEFPAIPTLADLGYREKLFGVWYGFYAPAGVPTEITDVLIQAVEKIAKNPIIAARLLPIGMIQEYSTPDAVLKEMREEYQSLLEISKKTVTIK